MEAKEHWAWSSFTDGTVAKVHAGPGESLSVDQAILEFE